MSCTLVTSVCGKECVVLAQAVPVLHHNNDRGGEISSSSVRVVMLDITSTEGRY